MVVLEEVWPLYQRRVPWSRFAADMALCHKLTPEMAEEQDVIARGEIREEMLGPLEVPRSIIKAIGPSPTGWYFVRHRGTGEPVKWVCSRCLPGEPGGPECVEERVAPLFPEDLHDGGQVLTCGRCSVATRVE